MKGERIGKAGRGKWLVTGTADIQKALKQLPVKLQKKVLSEAMRTALKPILADAKARAPFDTGKLRSEIKIRAMKRKGKRIGAEVIVGKGDFQGETFYAAFHEYGTSKMPAQPFMRPAFDIGAASARQEAIGLIRQGIDQAVKELKK